MWLARPYLSLRATRRSATSHSIRMVESFVIGAPVRVAEVINNCISRIPRRSRRTNYWIIVSNHSITTTPRRNGQANSWIVAPNICWIAASSRIGHLIIA